MWVFLLCAAENYIQSVIAGIDFKWKIKWVRFGEFAVPTFLRNELNTISISHLTFNVALITTNHSRLIDFSIVRNIMEIHAV